MFGRIWMGLFFAFAVLTVQAGEKAVDKTSVTLKAEDGLALKADWYSATMPSKRAVLLLHMMFSDRLAWTDTARRLSRQGFNVLAVDMRGFGATGGSEDWIKAQVDNSRWLAWLHKERGIAAGGIAVVGASRGAELALLACAGDKDCAAAVALSGGDTYADAESLRSLAGRPVLFMAAARDGGYLATARRLKTGLPGAEVTEVPGTAHGTRMLETDPALIDALAAWLDPRVKP